MHKFLRAIIVTIIYYLFWAFVTWDIGWLVHEGALDNGAHRFFVGIFYLVLLIMSLVLPKNLKDMGI